MENTLDNHIDKPLTCPDSAESGAVAATAADIPPAIEAAQAEAISSEAPAALSAVSAGESAPTAAAQEAIAQESAH